MPTKGSEGGKSTKDKKGKKKEIDYKIQFGNNENQAYHAFRYTDKKGLSRTDVQNTILRDIRQSGTSIESGSNTRSVIVDGIKLIYNAHLRPNGIINVGRIVVGR